MAEAPISGAAAYCQYGWEETAFATESASLDKAFGKDVKVTINPRMPYKRLYGLGSPEAVAAVALGYEGNLTIEFTLASSYFLKGVFGTVDDGGATPFTHTYDYNTGYTTTSMSIEVGFDLDTDNVYKFLGCVVDSCVISGKVGEEVKVTLNIKYANETKATTGLDAEPAEDAETPMTFAQGSLEIPNATTIARVDSFTLTIARNAKMLYGLGSRIPSAAIWLNTAFDFSLKSTYENDDFIEDFYGQTTGPYTATTPAGNGSLELTITNSGAGALERSVVFLMTTTYFEAVSKKASSEEEVMQDIVGFCLGQTSVIGSDNTETTP